MLGNTFGRMFRITTVGESYGIGKGSGLAVIIDGVPPGLRCRISSFRRRWITEAGVGQLNSPRQETDQCHIFAGLGQEGLNHGGTVGIIIYNVDTQQIHIDQYREYKVSVGRGTLPTAFQENTGNTRTGAEQAARRAEKRWAGWREAP